MKRTLKFALKLLGLHGGAMVASLFLVLVYGALWSSNAVFQWFMTVCIVAVLAILLWIPSTNEGVRDYMHDEILEKRGSQEPRWFYGGKGALAGLISQLPAVALALVSLLLPAEGAGRILRLGATGWYYMFKRLMDTWPQAWIWICLGGAAFSTLIAALAYINGRELRLRTKIIIARNDAKRARKKPNNR